MGGDCPKYREMWGSLYAVCAGHQYVALSIMEVIVQSVGSVVVINCAYVRKEFQKNMLERERDVCVLCGDLFSDMCVEMRLDKWKGCCIMKTNVQDFLDCYVFKSMVGH